MRCCLFYSFSSHSTLLFCSLHSASTERGGQARSLRAEKECRLIIFPKVHGRLKPRAPYALLTDRLQPQNRRDTGRSGGQIEGEIFVCLHQNLFSVCFKMLCKQTVVGPERSRQLICGAYYLPSSSRRCQLHRNPSELQQDVTLVWNRGSHLCIESASSFFNQDEFSFPARAGFDLSTCMSPSTSDSPSPSLPIIPPCSCRLLSRNLRDVQPTFSRVRGIQRIRRPFLLSSSKESLREKRKDRLLLLPWRGETLQILCFCDETRRFFAEESIPLSSFFRSISSSSGGSFPGCAFCSKQRSAFFLPSPRELPAGTSRSQQSRVNFSSCSGISSQNPVFYQPDRSVSWHSGKSALSGSFPRGGCSSLFSSKSVTALADEGIFAAVVDAGKGQILVGRLGGEGRRREGGEMSSRGAGGETQHADEREPDIHRETQMRCAQQTEFEASEVIPLHLCGFVRHIELLRVFRDQLKEEEDEEDETLEKEGGGRGTGTKGTTPQQNNERDRETQQRNAARVGCDVITEHYKQTGVMSSCEQTSDCVSKKRKLEEKEACLVSSPSESDRGGGETSVQEEQPKDKVEDRRHVCGDHPSPKHGEETKCLLTLGDRRRQRKRRTRDSSSKGKPKKGHGQEASPTVVLAVILESR